METIKAKLLKIMALAESGIAGEKENAKRMLLALCRKHHIHPDTLLSPKKTLYLFRHRGGKDKGLTLYCSIFIAGKDLKGFFGKRYLKLELTRAEAIDVADMIRHYRKAWRADVKDLFIAFVHRHHIALPSTETDHVKSIFPDRLERLLNMMRGIQSETWIRPAARLTG